MQSILHNSFQGGILASKYLSGGFDDLTNVDILTEYGTARCNKALIKKSGTNVNFPAVMATSRSGNTYLFSMNSGAISLRNPSGAYSAVTANSIATGHMDAYFFDDYIYYATVNKLGRMKDGQSDKDDDWQDFRTKTTTPTSHPMTTINKKLFIGDANNLAMMTDDGTWDNKKIALDSKNFICAMRPFGYDLIFFTEAGNYIVKAGAFRYDTSSVAWSGEDYLDEKGVKIAISSNTSDELYVLAGENGDIYKYDGIKFNYVHSIRGLSSVSGHNRLAVSIGRKSYFSPGNGYVYSLSHPIPGGEPVLNKEFACSAGSGATIYSLSACQGTLLVSWGLNGTYGIDEIDTNYAVSTLDTPVSYARARNIRVYYDSLPSGTSIGISYKNDNGDWTAGTVMVDTINKYVELDSEPGNIRSIQARITLTPNNAGTPATPIIQGIEIMPY